MDLRLPPPESEHLHLRTVRKATGRQSLQPSSRLPIPHIRPSRIQKESRIHKEKVQTHRKIRYTDLYRRKVANGRQICAECLLLRQYTVIEEASRKRFLYAYEEHSSFSTVDFLKRAIVFFGYAPSVLQTDNGGEFTHPSKTSRVHPLDVFCNRYHIRHKLIRPRTPWHNGKVERSHRNDQERFYNYLRFYSFSDLQTQMKRYLYRSNNIPMAVLAWKSPSQVQKELGGR